MSSEIKRIFVIGATGAQGMSVVRGLVADGKYKVLALTRDLASERAQQLQAMGNVTLLEGSFANEAILRSAFRALNCPHFRPDSRHKQKGSSTGLRTGLCLTHIDTLNC
ncbi:hypothetical protein B5M44_24600 [Shinella sumterensis]|uniref:NmrA family NAD(P)-binding protein n=1 Tax=Shinella sumterensis TaxID=1967501 RepID=UPI00106E3D14|nr:NmrA family NAD(P)-binding protein [Shinella sumterensis]MCD1267143.1 NmrA family NAD(P)-binding protein [Shinella sumterensis]TFE93801.1 hypothetical protein B5M44_24600 [Shinella sumterensis]